MMKYGHANLSSFSAHTNKWVGVLKNCEIFASRTNPESGPRFAKIWLACVISASIRSCMRFCIASDGLYPPASEASRGVY